MLTSPRRRWTEGAPWLGAAAVAFCYLAIALFALRAVLPAPARTAALPVDLPPAWRQITAADQKLVIAVVTAHARAILHAPTTLLDGPQCYPLRHALMLGQHELGQGLLGVVPYLLTADPLLTYNAVVVLSIALAGFAMHLLVRGYTGSTAAAVVAGTLFAVHPGRLGDLVHLSAIANYWTAFTLLCLHRFFARPTWSRALAVAACSSLQTLESIYPLVPHALIVATVSVGTAWTHRRAWRSFAPKLAAAGLVNLGAVALVLGPYLDFKATWGSLAGRQQLLYMPGDFGPGGSAYAGTLALGLLLVALVARRRSAAAETDPPPVRALVVAGLLVALGATNGIHLPLLDVTLPSFFALVGHLVPGLDAVRRGGAVLSGWFLVTSALAGLGVAALVRGRARIVGAGVAAVLVAGALGEVFVPPVARATFGRSVEVAAYVVRPPDAALAMYTRLRPGAVLDVPFELGPGRFFRMADFVLAGAYHGHRVAACYNSFRVAVQDDVARYAAHVLDDPHAADALAALAIRNVIAHLGLPTATGLPLVPITPAHLDQLGGGGSEFAFGIADDPATTTDSAALALALEAEPRPGSTPRLVLRFRNRAAVIYRHPDPIEPTELLIRSSGSADEAIREDRIRVLYPTVLSPGDEVRRELTVGPPAGSAVFSQATISRADDPASVLATLRAQ